MAYLSWKLVTSGQIPSHTHKLLGLIVILLVYTHNRQLLQNSVQLWLQFV